MTQVAIAGFLDLVGARQGHFRLESGLHSRLWLDLDALFADARRIEPLVLQLVDALRPHEVSGVCGPLLGGAFLAQLVAQRLGVEFCYAEREKSAAAQGLFQARYTIPPPLARRMKGKRFAIVDDVMSAGSALRGTYADLHAHGGICAVAGALLLLGSTGADYFVGQGVPVEAVIRHDFDLWEPAQCPLCAAGVDLEDVTAPHTDDRPASVPLAVGNYAEGLEVPAGTRLLFSSPRQRAHGSGASGEGDDLPHQQGPRRGQRVRGRLAAGDRGHRRLAMNDYNPIADLYDLYVTDTRDHGFWAQRAAEAVGPILELTAGTGRATVALRAGSSHPLVALDSSEAMLRRLAARLAGAPIPVRAVCGDLTALPFADGVFDLAVIPFNSLGEVVEAAERRRALQELRRVLTAAGRAVVTLHNPARRRLTLDGVSRTLDPVASGDFRLEVQVRGHLTGPDIAASEQTYRVLDPNGAIIEERRVTIRFALPDAGALQAMADEAGLRVHRVFGDYDESAFLPEQSPFILAVLEPARP